MQGSALWIRLFTVATTKKAVPQQYKTFKTVGGGCTGATESTRRRSQMETARLHRGPAIKGYDYETRNRGLERLLEHQDLLEFSQSGDMHGWGAIVNSLVAALWPKPLSRLPVDGLGLGHLGLDSALLTYHLACRHALRSLVGAAGRCACTRACRSRST